MLKISFGRIRRCHPVVNQTQTEKAHRGALIEKIIAHRNTPTVMAVTAAETDVGVLKTATTLMRMRIGRLKPNGEVSIGIILYSSLSLLFLFVLRSVDTTRLHSSLISFHFVTLRSTKKKRRYKEEYSSIQMDNNQSEKTTFFTNLVVLISSELLLKR